jgi:hypothetical protein
VVSCAIHFTLVLCLKPSWSLLQQAATPLAASRLFGTSFEIQTESPSEVGPTPALASQTSSDPVEAPAASPLALEPTLAPKPTTRRAKESSLAFTESAPSKQASSSATRDSASEAGVYGENGEASAPSQLRRAFIRTLPLAAKLNSGWLSVAEGDLGSAVFELMCDPLGQLQTIVQRSGSAHPLLAAAVLKTRVFLGKGRFMIAPQAGVRRLLVRVGANVSAGLLPEDVRIEDKECA